MDFSGALRPLDESLLRELPQLSLRIAPLREPVSSRTLSVPSPLEPNARGARETNTISKSTPGSGNLPANSKPGLPTVTEFLNAARTKKAEPAAPDPQSSVEPPPKPILPAFVNLRALERSPFSSSFDDNGPRKRRRLDLQAESFSEHLQLPIPQAQKEQRPPPFGPFAILNGLNEPPPNAALLPPIEAGSIPQLLSKPSREDAAVDPGSLVSANGALTEGQPVERREARIEELLGSTLDENDIDDDDAVHDDDDPERATQLEPDNVKSVVTEKFTRGENVSTPALDGNDPLSPKTRGRSRKNLRKWTDEETTDLLRGVVKCGIGNWTAILAQPELEFNKRTASNLKDRFRVCCPWAYRASDPNEATKQLRDNLANALLRAQDDGPEGTPGKIQLPLPTPPSIASEPNSGSGAPISGPHKPSTSSLSSAATDPDPGSAGLSSSASPAGETPPLSDKSQTTLASLGIPEAHVTMKPKRRSRRPFTTAEDEALLKGYAVHGFQWTLIQQDKRLNFGHRRATDLRDRFRTKFPHAYRHGGSVSGKSLHSQAQGLAPALSGSTSRDRPPSSESTPTKSPSTSHCRSNMHSHGRHTSMTNAGPIDSSFLPPPQGYMEPSTANSLSFPLDDSPATPWEDNTLAPMVWDDLG
ncbi:uncharacterized protein N7459_000515 [Penicillium hispanicum]|uniref:uncharacterized protein n=1 Tax=Penicillium hispanicum TaxID=1080232 RepID=UPI0025401CE5|nr:uncharacterized protein N7459_000515 [Penicillium hispanicum]KAJ5594307.1 hypothetical protein N7459_000515 [Penicillium hispanicum]